MKCPIIRPLFENAGPVWQPYKRKHRPIIEAVQRHYTKCIIGMGELDYEKRMRVLNLPIGQISENFFTRIARTS